MDEVGAGRIRAEQIYSITRFTPILMVASVCGACVMLATMHGDPRESWAIAWAFVVCALSAFFYVRTLRTRERARPTQASQRVIVATIRRSTLFGAVWAILPLIFLLEGDAASELTIFCLCCAMMGGGAFFLSAIPGAAACFFAPIMVAAVVAGYQIDDIDRPTFILLFFIFGVTLERMSQLYAAQLVARLKDEIEEQRRSGRDLLTGLLHREEFARELSVAFQRLNRFGEKFAVLNLSIDRAVLEDGLVNDADAVLVSLAKRIAGLVDQTDVVARVDSREFSILLSGVACVEEAANIAERLTKSLDHSIHAEHATLTRGWAAGIALAPKDGAGVIDLMRAVARACAAARESANRPVRFYDAADEAMVEDRRALAADLRAAIAKRQLHLEFQPIFDIRTRRISSCEALVRWNHPERGLLSPDVFIPLAERTGLIHEIGEWVMEDACRVLAKLPDDMRMAMNISAAQLRGDSVLSTLAHALSGSNISHDRVDIEVTESLLIARDDPALKVIEQLASAGFSITLDDFGTGYASLNYLGRLPLKRVKIDREFTGAMMTDMRHAAIVQAILQLSTSLRLEVTAEGVETPEQLEFLRVIGCDSAQGYLIAKPLSEPDLIALCESKAPLQVAA